MLGKKRSELLRVVILASLLALIVGVILVWSANNATTLSKGSPGTVNASANHTINFSVTNAGGSTVIQRVDITKPAGVTTIDCARFIPSGWSCDDSSASFVSFTNADGLAQNAVLNFSVASVFGATSGNQSFAIDTYDNIGGTINKTELKSNVTVDVDVPLIFTVNITGTNGSLDTNNLTAGGNQWIKRGDLTFNVTITDRFDNVVSAAVYINVSNVTTPQAEHTVMPHPSGVNTSYNNVVTLTRAASGLDRFNGTLSSTALYNGTIVYFVVSANDSVQNTNLSNSSASLVVANSAYNFTVDGMAPQLYTANFTDSLDGADDNITTSSATHNFTVTADDHGGSGVSRVELAVNVSNTLTYFAMQQVETTTFWHYTGTLQSLGVPSGDGNYTVWFRAYDNVTNVNESLVNINLLVDDPNYAVTLLVTNLTNNFTTSNATTFNIRFAVSGVTINTSQGSNFTINGPDNFRWNMSFVSSTGRWVSADGKSGVGLPGSQFIYSSTWNSTAVAFNGTMAINITGSLSNLSDFGCGLQGIGDQAGDDGDVCTLQMQWRDTLGRTNSTNISITVDNIAPRLINASSNATRSNVRVVRGGTIMNFSINVENNVQNVTIHNSSVLGSNVNSTLLTAVSGTNYTITLSANQLCSTGIEGMCVINFTTTDKANNRNTTNISFIVDNSVPLVSNFLVEGTNQFENQSGTGNVRLARSNLNLSITFNVSDQITNVTQVRIGNATMRNASFATANIPDGFANTSTLANFGCPANVEGVTCILTVEAYDNETIDGLRNVNTSVNLTFAVDDLAPRVNFSASLSQGLGYNVTSVNTVVLFLANITDANLPNFNVSIRSTTSVKLNKTVASTSNTTSIIWNGSYSLSDLGCASNGDCAITLVANDSAGNINGSQSITVTADSASLSISNRTFNAIFQFDDTPTLHVNTSKAALCRYSTTGVLGYSQMSSQFGSQGSRHNSVTLPGTPDGTYQYDVSCVDVAGVGEVNSTVRFTIDTINDTIITIDNRTIDTVFLFDDTPTVHVNLSANAMCRYSTTGDVTNFSQMTAPFNVNGTRHNSFTIAGTPDGTYEYPISCTTANNQNVVSSTVTFTIDTINDTTITINNRTFDATFISDSPTVHVNTSAPALCRYDTTGVTNYSQMLSANQFGTQDSRHNSFAISSDLRDATYEYDVSCVTANNQNVVSSTVKFIVDTTSLWNITIGATGTNGVKADYFTNANKFYKFDLKKSNVLSTTAVNTNFNVTNVLASIVSANPIGSTSNLSVLFAYNRTGDTWTSYVPGRASNDFNNFTTDTMDYYLNLTVANERIEIR